MQSAVIFAFAFALLAGSTLAARMIRLERERAAHYAHVIAECSNGRGYVISRTIVLCYEVQTGI